MPGWKTHLEESRHHVAFGPGRLRILEVLAVYVPQFFPVDGLLLETKAMVWFVVFRYVPHKFSEFVSKIICMNYENRFHVEVRKVLSVTTSAKVKFFPFLKSRISKLVQNHCSRFRRSKPILKKCGENERSQIEFVGCFAHRGGHENHRRFVYEYNLSLKFWGEHIEHFHEVIVRGIYLSIFLQSS